MIIIQPAGAHETCRSERDFMSAIANEPGIYIANVNLPASNAKGARTREVDGVLITTDGVLTVEVKGVKAHGVLHTPRMDSWSVVGTTHTKVIPGRPHSQALTHSKYLASFFKEVGIETGWVQAVLAISGSGVLLPEGADLLVTENVNVVLANDQVGQVLREKVTSAAGREVSLEAVQAILESFECVEGAPTRTQLAAEGFRAEQVISDDIEAQRQAAQAEFMASASTNHSPGHASASVQEAPSTSEWRATQERFDTITAYDDELSETGAVINGVAMHKRLVSYADRKGVPLEDLANIVNNATEIIGDETDQYSLHCGEVYAVSVRLLDGLAMGYKPVAIAKAERDGATVNGVEITGRAAKQALNQFNISLEAVSRIINAPDERWWVPGTTDIAHARGDIVAITGSQLGPVQHLQHRAVAILRAKPRAAEPEQAGPPTGEVIEGVVIRPSAVQWCAARNVSLNSVAQAVLNPKQAWEGHSPTVEVRTGETHAALIERSSREVVAVMKLSEAIEYHEGVVCEGVRFSGRCLFLAKRRKCSLTDLIGAVKAPRTIARSVGASQTYMIGNDVAAVVEDESGAVVDFTFATHARSLIRRGELLTLNLAHPGNQVRVGAQATPSADTARHLSRSALPSPLLMASVKRAQN